MSGGENYSSWRLLKFLGKPKILTQSREDAKIGASEHRAFRVFMRMVKRVGEGSALAYPATVTPHIQRLGRQINTLTYTPDVRTLKSPTANNTLPDYPTICNHASFGAKTRLCGSAPWR